MFAWFNNMKTMAKLMLGFAVTGVIMAVVGWVGITGMAKINANAENVYKVQLTAIQLVNNLQIGTARVRYFALKAVTATDEAERDASIKTIGEIAARNSELIASFEKTIVVDAVRKAFDEFTRDIKTYREVREKTLQLAREGNRAEAMARMGNENRIAYDAAIKSLEHLVELKTDVAKKKYEEGVKVYDDSKFLLTGVIVAGVLLGLFLGWTIARMIAAGLQQVNEVAQRASEGDLTKRTTLTTTDELGTVATAFNKMLDNITSVVTQVREGSENVSAASSQISTGNQDLSQRTSEQASALEETSSAMEEMTSTVKQNADNAKQANQLAVAARDTAEKGGAVTTKAVSAMEEINKSSKKIADIITVIDEIAFQTNLLALNAAVEAARAGEHGRGFAVVAAEVRNLAQRSATAAKEIKGLINESVQKVTDGSDLVNQSGKTLEEIVTSVKRVTDIISEIAAASQEQSSGIDQVNKAIMQMDETTQQNAALVEEAASASEGLQQQAAELLKLVEFFKVEEGHRAKTAKAPGATARKPAVHPAAHVGGLKPASPAAAGKDTGRRPAHAGHPAPVAVGVGSGNGHGHIAKDDFEEF